MDVNTFVLLMKVIEKKFVLQPKHLETLQEGAYSYSRG